MKLRNGLFRSSLPACATVVLRYISMESQSSSELRALWKWPDENDPEEDISNPQSLIELSRGSSRQDTEDLLHELGVTSSRGTQRAAES